MKDLDRLMFVGALLSGCSPERDAAPPDTRQTNDVPVEVAARAPGGDKSAVPSIPGLRIAGRWDGRDPSGPRLGWPGTRLVVRFRGPSASFRLVDTFADEGPSRYDVLVDGARQDGVLTAQTTPTEHEVARGLSAGEHTIELVRRTEGRLGTTQIFGISVLGGELLAPAAPPQRRIEFLGDSEANGYGIEGNGPDCTFSPETQNERKAYPALVAAALGAEHMTIAWSGKGVFRNADRSDGEVFAHLYPRAVPGDASSRWSSTDLPADVVVIALGGNDWERPSTDVYDPPDVTALRAAYERLLSLVRASHPRAHVFCTHPASLTNDHPEGYDAYSKMKGVLQAVVDGRVATGDARVHYLELPRAADADRTGCDHHYGPAFHARVADSLVPTIRAIAGW